MGVGQNYKQNSTIESVVAVIKGTEEVKSYKLAMDLAANKFISSSKSTDS